MKTRRVNIRNDEKIEIYYDGVLLTKVALANYRPSESFKTVLIDTGSCDEFGLAYNEVAHNLLKGELK